jgi:uncharacterized protein (TIGR03067 family)
MGNAFTIIMNPAMQIEQEQTLTAEAHLRTAGSTNRFKSRIICWERMSGVYLRVQFLSIMLGVLLIRAAGMGPTLAQTPAPDDRAISVGHWDVAAVEMNGRPIDPELLAMLHVLYRADGSWAVLFKSLTVAEGTSTNREDAAPKTFEMTTLGSGSIKPSRYTGIYKHEGDTRVLCLVPDGKPRPADFTAPRRSGRTLVTLRRATEP